MDIDFYDVIPGNLTPSIIRLLSKAYASNQRCIFMSPDEERVKVVDKTLWTFSTKEFIPHGDKELGFCDKQPIYFTSTFENPNNATVLIMCDSFDFQQYTKDLNRIILVFENDTEKAEALYHTLKKENNNVNYWKQSPNGWGKL